MRTDFANMQPKLDDQQSRLFMPRERTFSRRGVFGGNYVSPNPVGVRTPLPPSPVKPPDPVRHPKMWPKKPWPRGFPPPAPKPVTQPFGKRLAVPYTRNMKWVPGLGWVVTGLLATDWLWINGEGLVTSQSWRMGGNWTKICGPTPAPPTYIGWPGPNCCDPVGIATTPLCGLGGQSFPNAVPLGTATTLSEWGMIFLTGPNGAGRYFINEMWNRPVGSPNPAPAPIYTPWLPATTFPPVVWPDTPVIPDVVDPDRPPGNNPEPPPYPAIPHVPPVWPSVRTYGDTKTDTKTRRAPRRVGRPPPRVKEKKQKWSKGRQLLWDIFQWVKGRFHSVTEWTDFIDCFGPTKVDLGFGITYETTGIVGFPRNAPPHVKVEFILRNADRIIWGDVIFNLAYNHIEDAIVGYVSGRAPKGSTTPVKPDIPW